MNYKKIKLAVFDWAGTTVDYGCMAPYVVFDETFKAKNIYLTKAEILEPMGMEKRDHIRTLLSTEKASAQWYKEYGRIWNDDDINDMYEFFEARLAEVAADFSEPVDGVVDTIKELRKNGIMIGSTTGYTGAMMENVIPKAKALGYEADYVVTPEIVGSGRPAPFMIYENMRKFNVYPPENVIKIGDTVMDILEGKNAGVWSVGVLDGSSEVALSKEEMSALSAEEIDIYRKNAINKYKKAGADYIIDSIKDIPELIKKINERMQEEK
ncbi:MAG: phosphonoacetaldehyde hydrolase [Clostridia bacterium]|nr:phosphonoacetaldehyde hydrolase [Clostridia bacterium]